MSGARSGVGRQIHDEPHSSLLADLDLDNNDVGIAEAMDFLLADDEHANANRQGPIHDNEEDDDEEADSDVDDDDEEDDDPHVFKPEKDLEENSWHRRPVSDLIDMMNSPYLVLDPSYQRGVVWKKDRQTRLINSILSNYYVPPVIFNVKCIETPAGTKQHRVCIDGKQRLSSISAFVAGRIPCTDHKRRKWYFTQHGAPLPKGAKILPEDIREKFRSTILLCIEYQNLKRSEEEELFSRVQMGMELKPAEKLRARSGKWQDFAILLEKKHDKLVSLIDNGRGNAFQAIISSFRILMSDEDSPPYTTTQSSLQSFLEKPALLDEAFRNKVVKVYEKFDEVYAAAPNIFQDNAYQHSRRFAPIEFVGVTLLIDRYPGRSVELLAGDIRQLRKELRAKRQELRSNSATFSEIADFVLNLEKKRRGQGFEPRSEDDSVVESDDEIEDDSSASERRAQKKICRTVKPKKTPPAPQAQNQQGKNTGARGNISNGKAIIKIKIEKVATSTGNKPPTMRVPGTSNVSWVTDKTSHQPKSQNSTLASTSIPRRLNIADITRVGDNSTKTTDNSLFIPGMETPSAPRERPSFLPDLEPDPVPTTSAAASARKRRRTDAEDDNLDLNLDAVSEFPNPGNYVVARRFTAIRGGRGAAGRPGRTPTRPTNGGSPAVQTNSKEYGPFTIHDDDG